MAEPALLIGHRGAIATNPAGQSVADDPTCVADLVRIATAAIQAGTSIRRVLPVIKNGRHVLLEFDVSAWGKGHALALGRDVTVSTGVREALEISRERYRALLEIAVDCIWETAQDGTLELLAPNNIFGRAAATLIGQPLRALITGAAPGFHTGREPRAWRPAGLIAQDGRVIIGAAVAEPILEPDSGRPHGFRGCFRRSPVTEIAREAGE